MAKNRDGVIQPFPLMTVSAAVMCYGFGYQNDYNDNERNEIFGVLKKNAKASLKHIACADLGIAKLIL